MTRQYIRIIMLSSYIGCLLPVWTEAVAYSYNDDSYINDRTLGESYFDTARVIDVEPVYERVEQLVPVKECWTERPRHHYNPSGGSFMGTLVGGVLGGVIGNQFGRGRGKQAATAVGSITGAALGHSVTRYSSRSYGNEERCEVIEQRVDQQRLAGYRVTYRYKGKTFETQTLEHPGETIRLQVNVDPR